MRWIKWALGIVVLLVLLAVGALFLIPADKIAAIAAGRFEAATGRTLTIGGPIRPSLWPSLGLTAQDIQISNAEWSKDPVMVKADALRISVALGSVFSGTPRIQGVTLEGPDLLLEKSKDGKANWQFEPKGAAKSAGSSAPASGGAAAPAFTLDSAKITGGRVTYRDDASGQSYMLSDLDVSTSIASMAEPATVNFKGRLGDETLAGDLTLAKPGAAMTGSGTGLVLHSLLGKANVDFDGTLDPAGKTMLSGKLSANLPDSAATLAALGQPGIDLPEGLGRKIALKTDLAYAGTRLTAEGLDLKLDGNALAGKAAVDLAGDVPYLTATLSGGDLDLSSLSGDTKGAAGAGPSRTQTGWSKDPITLSGLDAIDADVALTAKSIDLGTAKFAQSKVSAHLKGGKLTTKLIEVQGYGGTMTGTLNLTGGDNLSLGGNILAKSVTLQSFMKDFFDFDKITGTGDITADFTASGGSMDALMHAVNGNGKIDFGHGEILGIDLAGMLTNLDSAFGNKAASTIFNSITATFKIRKGVVDNVDLNLLAPLFEAKGEGKIGLGDQTIDYRVTPSVLKGDAADSGIKVPVLITGSWSNLKFRPDLKALIDNNAQVKAAKEKANKAIDNAKKDAQKKLEDQIKKGIGGLLNGN